MKISANTLIAETLTAHGVRPTHQRIAVYEHLISSRNHPSADDIYKLLIKKHPVFSRTTIYNSLKILVTAGLVRVVSISSEEQHFDAFTDDHGHFLCVKCNKIFDFPLTQKDINSMCPSEFVPNQSDVFFKGSCPSCNQCLEC